jgi:tRNA A37 threonylcarbamoyladenosine dehydratase
MRSGAERRTDRTAMLLGQDRVDALRRSHVMIFGLGGVGSYAAEALGRMGIGKLTIVDGDRFEESNINRQLCALTSTIGRSKVSVTAQRLRDINPDAVIVPVEKFYLPEAPVPIDDGVDMVVDAVDTVTAKLDIVETCKAKNIPLVSCMGMGNRLDPTQIKIGDLFDTDTCALCRVMRKELRRRGIDTLRCVYSTEEARTCESSEPFKNAERMVPGSVSYVPSVAGLLMASDVIHTLCYQIDSRDCR